MSLIGVLEKIKDVRVNRTKKYELVEILFLAVSAAISGYDAWEDIEEFGEAKLEWLRKYLPYSNGVPSHDTINRVVSIIDPRTLEKCLIDWVSMEVKLPKGAVISIDGKALRRSVTAKEQQTSKSKGGKSMAMMLHAWCSDINICLAQHKIDYKNNEISELPNLLELLDIEGCIITTDAINFQKKTTQILSERGADYVIAAKKNQETLYLAIEAAFEQNTNAKSEVHEEKDKAHGREESRVYEVLDAATYLKDVDLTEWVNLKSIIKTTYIHTDPFKATKTDIRYHISSLSLSAADLGALIRRHWSVENQLHWRLDVLFGEDASRKRIRNAATNFSLIRKMSINLLNSLELDKKTTLSRKRVKCSLNDSIREKCLGI